MGLNGQQRCEGPWVPSAYWEPALKDGQGEKQTESHKGKFCPLKTKREGNLVSVLPALALGDIPKEIDRGLWTLLIHTYFGFFVRYPYWEKHILLVNIKLTL